MVVIQFVTQCPVNHSDLKTQLSDTILNYVVSSQPVPLKYMVGLILSFHSRKNKEVCFLIYFHDAVSAEVTGNPIFAKSVYIISFHFNFVDSFAHPCLGLHIFVIYVYSYKIEKHPHSQMYFWVTIFHTFKRFSMKPICRIIYRKLIILLPP